MKAGMIVTAVAAAPLTFAKAAAAQKAGDGSLHSLPGAKGPGRRQPDLIGYYDKATFAPYVGTQFRVAVKTSKVRTITLVEINEALDASAKDVLPKGECFSLLFTSPAGMTFPQKTYEVEHAALGKFSLFLVPVERHTGINPEYHEAVFNRISKPSPRDKAPRTQQVSKR
ncbi:MAG TPA: hypothetical protein VGN95_18720 [Pyrinomonadaceae bacterium]|jgi:hypothetical protein|nr:hypothetical protein [Pyrinomonadaceae bacterium]